jgi:CheY-like chemotaxis protein
MNPSALLWQTSNQCVLVVDDNPDNTILLQYMLEDLGFKTCIADCGRAAIAMMESQAPDLILLDLMMPDINGLEVARYIRGNPFIQNIPIVLVTAYTEEIEDEDYRLLNGVLAKPIDETKLLSLLKSMINNVAVDLQ